MQKVTRTWLIAGRKVSHSSWSANNSEAASLGFQP
jgi:hypothetical protein